MNKHSALKELGAVLRQSPLPAHVSKLESGPKPLSPRVQYSISNSQAASSSTHSSSLLSSFTGGSSPGSTSSLFHSFHLKVLFW